MASMWPVTILFALGLSALGLSAPGAAGAQPVARPYVSLGAGLNLQQNEAQAAPSFRYALFQPARSLPAGIHGLGGSLSSVPAGAGPGGPHAHRVDIVVQS